MDTKEPGYYRNLIENIEGSPAAPSNDKAKAIALATGIRGDIEKALHSQDRGEVERLLHGAFNSMDDLIDAMRLGMR